ncbi:hypothetical protein [Dactylosporangium sp. CA-139066]|uniref:hypothetical protein n=1 Tax=Dactylosporangium sp. CA-139066 TaxID=3239930 RepID=UPI003D9078FA
MPVTPARGRQLSLFGVEARAPAPIDLEGLLAGAGQVGRMGGTARVSIVVDDGWRALVLRDELEARGLVVSCEATGEEDRRQLRTAYSSALAPLARRWLDEDGVKIAPRGLTLDGRALRLWVAAAGAYDGQRAFLLRLAPRPLAPPEEPEPEPLAPPDLFAPEEPEAPAAVVRPPQPRPERPNVRKRKSESKITAFDPGPDEFADAEEYFGDPAADEWPDSGVGDLPTVVLDPISVLEPPPPPVEEFEDEEVLDRRVADNWIAVGDALEAVGLPAVLVGAETGAPAYRIVGPRRITRLAELVGEPPAAAPTGAWPA